MLTETILITIKGVNFGLLPEAYSIFDPIVDGVINICK